MLEVVVEDVNRAGAGEGEGEVAFVEELRGEVSTHDVEHGDVGWAEEAGDYNEVDYAGGVAGGCAGGGGKGGQGGAAGDGAVGVGEEEDVVGFEFGEEGRADGGKVVLEGGGLAVDVLLAVAREVDADEGVAGGFEFFADGVEMGGDVLGG